MPRRKHRKGNRKNKNNTVVQNNDTSQDKFQFETNSQNSSWHSIFDDTLNRYSISIPNETNQININSNLPKKVLQHFELINVSLSILKDSYKYVKDEYLNLLDKNIKLQQTIKDLSEITPKISNDTQCSPFEKQTQTMTSYVTDDSQDVIQFPKCLDIPTQKQVVLSPLKLSNVDNKMSTSINSSKLIRVIFTNLSDNISLPNIMTAIYENTNVPEHQIVFIRKNKLRSENKYNWILDLSPTVAKQLIKKENIMIDTEFCQILLFVFVKRCFTCQGFYHIAAHCTNERACAVCGQFHFDKYVRCQNSPKCINCTKMNINFNSNYNTTHQAFSSSCPTMRDVIEKKRSALITTLLNSI